MTLPIAGWYPDPQDPMQVRWWDGTRWGELAPQPAAALTWSSPSGTVAGAPVAAATPAWAQPAAQQPSTWTQPSVPQRPAFSATPDWEASPRPPAPSARGARSDGTSYLRGYGDDGQRMRGRRAWAENERAARAVNPASYTGLLLAVIGAIINPFAILSILAVVFGAIGLGRAGALSGARHTGRGLAMTAVLLGIVETVWFAIRFAQLAS